MLQHPTQRKEVKVITKNEILEESKFFMGNNNPFLKTKNPKRRDMIKELIKRNLLLRFEERATLKRELQRRKIVFPKNADSGELVGIAMDNKLNFDQFIL